MISGKKITTISIIALGLVGFMAINHDQVRRLSIIVSGITLRLPGRANIWCDEPVEPALDYHKCNATGTVYEIKYSSDGGFKGLLLSVIKALEESSCFYISNADPNVESALARHYAPMGLSKRDPIVIMAKVEDRIKPLDWWMVAADLHNHRYRGTVHTIPGLDLKNVEGHWLKQTVLKRLWRPTTRSRWNTCMGLESKELSMDYLAFNIEMDFHLTQTFIDEAQKIMDTEFGRYVPKIFVATADCSILAKFREMKPEWEFVSGCDQALPALRGVSPEQMVSDLEFREELFNYYGLANAKFVIGDRHSAMTWWAYMMRREPWSFKLLDAAWFQGDKSGTW